MSDTINDMRRIFDEALSLATTKNADYGDAWRDQGWRGNLSRLFEKCKRLRTLLWRRNAQPTMVRENVRETAIDMINTLAFFVMNHDAGVEWGDEAPFGTATEPVWRMGVGTILTGDLPSPETLQTIQEGLNPFVDTDPSGTPLPVRLPGEELSEDQTPSPRPRPKREKPVPTNSTLPRAR